MFILKGIVSQCYESVQVELPRPNMIIDPRPNFPLAGGRFVCSYHDNGTTVTLTRDNQHYGCDWSLLQFRVYDPALENVPNFNSTIYIYMGVDGERAPSLTTVLIIDSSVKVIKKKAFRHCEEIKKCYMYDGVHTIEEYAFLRCSSMRVIRLSQNLKVIEREAFCGCRSLEAIFLPPSVKTIGKEAFKYCTNIRILALPLNIDISQVKAKILKECHTFFRVTHIQRYQVRNGRSVYDGPIRQAVLDFYRNLPPLHKACLLTNISAQTVRDCVDTYGPTTASSTDHDGMTPLHILAMNPHADVGAILTCFDANMSAAFTGDARDRTPLDYLREYHDIEDHTSLVVSLCMHREMMG